MAQNVRKWGLDKLKEITEVISCPKRVIKRVDQLQARKLDIKMPKDTSGKN